MDNANGHEYTHGIPKRTRTTIHSHRFTHAKSKTTAMANCSSLNPIVITCLDYIVYRTLDKMVRKSKRKRDPARPKRAMTPFLYYACEQRNILKQNGDKMTLPEQSIYIAQLWKNVTDEGKVKYVEQSEKDKARYRDEMSRYHPPFKIKRPRSSYAFFMKNMRQEIAEQHKEKNPRELMSDIAAAWRNISEEDKIQYNEMATEDKKRYEEEKKNLAE